MSETTETAGPKMAEVRFHAASGRVVIELDNLAMIAFPVGLSPELAGADEAALGQVVVTGDGHVLHWPALGVHLSYLGILTDILGARAEMVRLAGSAATRGRKRAERDAEGGPRGRRR